MNINKKGINLIILVITIIVMIIIASAVILYLTDNNVIDSANTAVNKTNFNAIQDAARAEASNYLLNNEDYETAEKYIKAKLIANNVITEEQASNYSFNDDGTIIEKGEKEQKYVKTNLQLWLDGINNTRAGHNSSATVWKDLSGNNYDSISESLGITIVANGYKCNANNGYMKLNSNIAELFANTGTIEVTFKMDVLPNRDFALFSNYYLGPYYSSYERLIYNSVAGTNQGLMYEDRLYGMKGNIYCFTKTMPKINELTTVTIVHNPLGTWNIYINGEHMLTQSYPVTEYSITGSYDMLLFNDYRKDRAFLGTIHSLRAYDRCLSQEEITSNYNVDVYRFEKK